MMTLRCILAPPPRGLTRSTTRNSRRGRGASRVRSQGRALVTVKRGAAACLPLCAALSPDAVLGTNLSGHRGVCEARGALYGGRGRADFRSGLRGRRRVPMNELLLDYLPLAVFIAVASGIALALLVIPFLLAYKRPDSEKLSAYECGFNAFDDARMTFDVRFYLVAILFIIFDLEVSFLFPWAVAFGDIGVVGFWSMVVFLGVLTVGFIYEWRKGALEWD